MIKILGIADLFSAVILLITNFYLLGDTIYYCIAAYLILKGLFFTAVSKDPASIIDIAAGLYGLSISLGIYHYSVSAIFIIYLGQKGIFSLIRF